MNVLAVDPGLVTGFAFWDGDTANTSESTNGLLGAMPVIMMCLPEIDVLVVEKFTINARTFKLSPQLDALYIIGNCIWLAHKRKKRLILQSPSERGFITSVKLAKLGWNLASQDDAKSAAQHLALFLYREGVLSPQDVS